MRHLKLFDTLAHYCSLCEAGMEEDAAQAVIAICTYLNHAINDCLNRNFNTDQAGRRCYQPINFDPFWCIGRLRAGGAKPRAAEAMAKMCYDMTQKMEAYLLQQWYNANLPEA